VLITEAYWGQFDILNNKTKTFGPNTLPL